MVGIQVETLPDTKVCPRPAGLSLQENLRHHLDEGKQMTAASLAGAGASSTGWDAIDWHSVERHVRRLQVRTAKVPVEGCTCLFCHRVLQGAFERLEPYAVKVARTVLSTICRYHDWKSRKEHCVKVGVLGAEADSPMVHCCPLLSVVRTAIDDSH
jgi:hypothetical protein